MNQATVFFTVAFFMCVENGLPTFAYLKLLKYTSMQKRFLFSLLLLLITGISFAQLKSPEAFLGYKIGSRYTPHFKVVNYYNHVAANSNIKLTQYGETNEGRPLLLAFISSPENMKNLENIRRPGSW